MLATPVIQMPTITAVKAVSLSNPNQHPFLRPHLVGFCLRKPKIPSTTRTALFCCKSQLQDFAPLTSAAYGTLLFSGGLLAFTKSGSKGSLFGGLTGAALMASAYYLMQSTETKAIGDALGFGSAFLFSCVFGIRLAATRKPIPAGPLLGLSICALVVFTSAYLQDRL
ncbi:LOW QUALITY PROTEIN: protein FATTY ACID EXPORT 4, chloroplastic [Gossypium raimondii]|uniref:LOW QUALITY PROTEIN: protein FATTY ACID EXPORT 4, chloroplastic n=1 Tax=Gossypium raimondii TaxID=29730 RepID=UPI00227A6A84|nr:LOW QUALITY PROTEIN: protein FATTY ACID EXPORT 4, chloroplastic [Gossypium raimondii]